MAPNSVIGIHVYHCQHRKKHRAFFYGGRYTGWETGSALVHILKGRAFFNVGGASFIAEKDDTVLWAPRSLNEFRPHPDSPLVYYVMQFDIHTAPAGIATVSSLGLPHVVRCQHPKRIRGLLGAMSRVFNGGGRYFLEDCSVLGVRLLRVLRETQPLPGKKGTRESVPPSDRRIREVLNFMAENYKANLSIPSLARRAGVHPVHFNRLFKRMMGQTPHQFIMDKKIEKAKDYLRLYDDQPSAMGLEFKFHDDSHFYRTFKKRVGMTPSEYIKRKRKVWNQP